MTPADRTQDEIVALLERLKEAFGVIVRKYRIPAEDAQDVVQDAVLAYLERREQITQPDRWLLATVRLKCCRYWRSHRRQLLSALDDALLAEVRDPSGVSEERSVLAQDLDRVLRRVSTRCQQLLRFRYGLDLRFKGVGAAMGLAPETAKRGTLRCLSALGRTLRAGGYDGAAS